MLDELKNFISLQASNVIYVKIRVITKSSKTEITEKLEDGSFKIRVKAVPEKNKANEEIESFLKKGLGVVGVEVVGGQRED